MNGINLHQNVNDLTKREKMALQILVSLAQGTGPGRLPSVRDAVQLADTLIKTLATTAP